MARDTTARMVDTPIQKASLAVGAAFALIGVLGFIPGITTNFDAMEFAGPESEAMLLGIFQVSVLHNLVHLGFGVLGIAAATMVNRARFFLVGGGLVYALLWVYGLIIDHDTQANFVPVNTADDWLHFVLAVVMIGLGLGLSRGRRGSLT